MWSGWQKPPAHQAAAVGAESYSFLPPSPRRGPLCWGEPISIQELPELFPVREFYSHVLFPPRFFLGSGPTSLSQITVPLPSKFTEPLEMTPSKVVRAKKYRCTTRWPSICLGLKSVLGSGTFRAKARRAPVNQAGWSPYNIPESSHWRFALTISGFSLKDWSGVYVS